MILSLTLFLIGILGFVLNNQLVKYAYLCTLILSELNTIDLLIIGFFAIFIIAKLLYIFSYRIKSLDCYITVLLNGFLSLSNNKEVSTFCLILALFSKLLGTAFSIFIDLTLSGPDVQYIADNQLYNSIITAHAIFMIFFMIIPALIGGFGNFIYSLMRVDYLPSNNIHLFFFLI